MGKMFQIEMKDRVGETFVVSQLFATRSEAEDAMAEHHASGQYTEGRDVGGNLLPPNVVSVVEVEVE
jgi:hypothetical protein